MTHHWPAIRVKRFRGEARDAYDQRRSEIIAIIEGFRKSRFGSDLADKLDQRLDDLLTGLAEGSRPDPFGLLQAEAAAPRRAQIYLVTETSSAA
jgi:hypothetical protein